MKVQLHSIRHTLIPASLHHKLTHHTLRSLPFSRQSCLQNCSLWVRCQPDISPFSYVLTSSFANASPPCFPFQITSIFVTVAPLSTIFCHAICNQTRHSWETGYLVSKNRCYRGNVKKSVFCHREFTTASTRQHRRF